MLGYTFDTVACFALYVQNGKSNLFDCVVYGFSWQR